MNYPAWDVPLLGSSLAIAIIAIIHVFISHFAVGGGFFLPAMEKRALDTGREDWLAFVKRHSHFFLIVTGVFGAVTGVGIWFVVALGSAPGISTLIHYWVFGWGMEWCIFVIELATIAVYWYTWDRVPPRVHEKIGWLYSVSSWLTLFLINGILSFMLSPSDAWLNSVGTPEGQSWSVFWTAFFNPTYFPSLLMRTLMCFSLAAVWGLITVSRLNGEQHAELKREVADWTRRWMLPGFILLPILLVWYLCGVPSEQRPILLRGVNSAAAGQFTQATHLVVMTLVASFATVVAAWLFTGRRSAPHFSTGGALLLALCAFTALGGSEGVREMLRKPYVVQGYMYSNGVLVKDVDRFNRHGYLTDSPMAIGAAPADIGKLMVRGQCLSCHTLDGYRPLKKLLAGRNRESVASLMATLHDAKPDSPYIGYMPPLVGTDEEIAALVDYLASLVATNSTGAAAATTPATTTGATSAAGTDASGAASTAPTTAAPANPAKSAAPVGPPQGAGQAGPGGPGAGAPGNDGPPPDAGGGFGNKPGMPQPEPR